MTNKKDSGADSNENSQPGAAPHNNAQTETTGPMLHSEELFRTLYDNLPGGMFIVGRDYTIKDVNKITCEITGYSGDVIAQRGVLDSDTNYLYKPFTVKSLTSKVREVFDS